MDLHGPIACTKSPSDPSLMTAERREMYADYGFEGAGVVRSQDYVESECRRLCDQIVVRYPIEVPS